MAGGAVGEKVRNGSTGAGGSARLRFEHGRGGFIFLPRFEGLPLGRFRRRDGIGRTAPTKPAGWFLQRAVQAYLERSSARPIERRPPRPPPHLPRRPFLRRPRPMLPPPAAMCLGRSGRHRRQMRLPDRHLAGGKPASAAAAFVSPTMSPLCKETGRTVCAAARLGRKMAGTSDTGGNGQLAGQLVEDRAVLLLFDIAGAAGAGLWTGPRGCRSGPGRGRRFRDTAGSTWRGRLRRFRPPLHRCRRANRGCRPPHRLPSSCCSYRRLHHRRRHHRR